MEKKSRHENIDNLSTIKHGKMHFMTHNLSISQPLDLNPLKTLPFNTIIHKKVHSMEHNLSILQSLDLNSFKTLPFKTVKSNTKNVPFEHTLPSVSVHTKVSKIVKEPLYNKQDNNKTTKSINKLFSMETRDNKQTISNSTFSLKFQDNMLKNDVSFLSDEEILEKSPKNIFGKVSSLINEDDEPIFFEETSVKVKESNVGSKNAWNKVSSVIYEDAPIFINETRRSEAEISTNPVPRDRF